MGKKRSTQERINQAQKLLKRLQKEQELNKVREELIKLRKK
jgi:hypothetical protein